MSAQATSASVTTPITNRQGKVVPVKQLHLVELPDVMDRMGWTTAAKLMRHWFSRKTAWVMPDDVKKGDSDPFTLLPQQVNTDIVRLDWVLNFKRVEPVVADLFANWNNVHAIKVLKDRLLHRKWKPGTNEVSIGFGSQDSRDLDALCQVNARTFGGKLDPLDDLYGALGIATLKVAVAGTTVTNHLGEPEFETERIGLYVRDTYDFNATGFEDAVPLGVWSRDRCLNKSETSAFLALSITDRLRAFPGCVPVYNEDFRRWQRANHAGGDFVVYSDFKWFPGNYPRISLK